MAVVMIVEDGTGVTGANSYITVADADAYIEANSFAFADWDALSTAQKEALLVWGTRYIDIRVKWEGTKVYSDLWLSWPREGVYDHENDAVDSDVIPIRLQYAVAEVARFLINSDLSAPGTREGIERIRVDVIELYLDANYKQMTIPDDVILLLRGLGIIINPGGHTFGKISRA
jgi:hypothetical protein